MPRRTLAAVVMLVAATGCGHPQAVPRVALSGLSLGTHYAVKAAALPTGLTEQKLHAAIQRRLTVINGQMSTYLPDSELSRFNRHTGDDWFPVSADTARVVAAALEVSRRTDGLFDVTVGPLVILWNFGPDARPDHFPTAAEIAAAKARVGYQKVEVQSDPPALRKTQPDVYLDLSAIAKGFAVDAVAEVLEASGIRDYMVEIGGEVRTRGAKPDGTPWRIGIERPSVEARAVHCVVTPGDRALATSGDYRNYFEHDGRRYSHTIDPRTGRPVEHSLASVSVAADSCMTADAWATALMVMGPEAAFRCAPQHGLEVLLLIRDGERIVERETPGFPRERADGENPAS